MLIESGHLIQNISLVSAGENISSLPLGGFYDDRLAKFIGVNQNDEPIIYGLALGYS